MMLKLSVAPPRLHPMPVGSREAQVGGPCDGKGIRVGLVDKGTGRDGWRGTWKCSWSRGYQSLQPSSASPGLVLMGLAPMGRDAVGELSSAGLVPVPTALSPPVLVGLTGNSGSERG